jgi:DNA primase
MHTSAGRASHSQIGAILAHYERVAPLIAASFPNAPLVAQYAPHGLSDKPTYSRAWEEPLPESVPAIAVRTASGTHTYPGCTPNAILWLVHRYAIGIQSWTPSASNPQLVGCARILLRPVGGASQELLKEGLLAVRTSLYSYGNECEAVPMFEGGSAAALFIPFSDAPTYEAVRDWLHRLLAHAIGQHPALLVPERHPHETFDAARIQCTVVSNAVGLHSALPYSLSVSPELFMATPFNWDELGALHNGAVTASNAQKRLSKGDVFGTEVRRIGHQRFAELGG